MPLRNPAGWWRKTRIMAGLCAAAVFCLAAAGAILAGFAPHLTIFAMPAAQFLCVVCLPFALAVAVYFMALHQEQTDRDHSVWEGR